MHAREPVVMNNPGRNDPCPCGSGKKYKKCHGLNAATAAAAAKGPNEIGHALKLYEKGRLVEALDVCHDILMKAPKNTDALLLAGAIEAQRNRFPESEKFLAKAAALQQKNPSIHSNLCHVLLKLGKIEEAERHGGLATSLDPSLPDAWNNLGNVYRVKKQVDPALDAYSNAIRLASGNAGVLCNIGLTYEIAGNLDEARVNFESALSLDPKYVPALVNIGNLLLSQNNYEGAKLYFEKALSFEPSSKEAHSSLARLYLKQNNFDESEKHFLVALEADPRDPVLILAFAEWLERQEKWQPAIECLRKGLEVATHYPEIRSRLALVLGKTHRYKDALAVAEDAVGSDPQDQGSQLLLAHVLTDMGRYQDARQIYQNLISANGGLVETYQEWSTLEEKTNNLEDAKRYAEEALRLELTDKRIFLLLARIERRLKNYTEALRCLDEIEIDESDESELCSKTLFEYGNIFDRLGKFDSAWSAYQRAARIRGKYRNAHFDAEENGKKFLGLREFYTYERLQGLPQYQPDRNDHRATPIFIVGMPRSGTTLLEQILCSHSEISAGDELPFIGEISLKTSGELESKEPYPDCLQALSEANKATLLKEWREYYFRRARDQNIDLESTRFFTDKMPLNLNHMVLICLVFPESPIIHIVRNPMDVCLSAMFSSFARGHEWANDIVHAAWYCRSVFELATHFKGKAGLPFMQLRYEDLVGDQERYSREVLEYVGVPWDDRVLQFHKTSRVARTASYAQVNQKIYTTSVERYRNYEAFLQEPLEILRPVMEQYGYL